MLNVLEIMNGHNTGIYAPAQIMFEKQHGKSFSKQYNVWIFGSSRRYGAHAFVCLPCLGSCCQISPAMPAAKGHENQEPSAV